MKKREMQINILDNSADIMGLSNAIKNLTERMANTDDYLNKAYTKMAKMERRMVTMNETIMPIKDQSEVNGLRLRLSALEKKVMDLDQIHATGGNMNHG